MRSQLMKSDLGHRESVMKRLSLSLVLLGLFVPVLALVQRQSAEMVVVGQVRTVDPSRTELTLADGAKLLTPPGAMLQAEALREGILVVAAYREEENGNKILMRLSRGQW